MRPDIEERNGEIYRMFLDGIRRKVIARLIPGMTYESVKKVIQLCERRITERRAAMRDDSDRRQPHAREILSPFFPIKF